ncbi:hypothetical protein BROUX41_004459 [Berkeleyomyces rouxiae]
MNKARGKRPCRCLPCRPPIAISTSTSAASPPQMPLPSPVSSSSHTTSPQPKQSSFTLTSRNIASMMTWALRRAEASAAPALLLDVPGGPESRLGAEEEKLSYADEMKDALENRARVTIVHETVVRPW